MADASVPVGITSLTDSLKQDNPALYTILSNIIAKVNALNTQLNPPVVSNRVVSNPTILPDDVENFVYSLTLDNVILNWSPVTTAVTYEIRKGAAWGTASYVTTLNSLQSVLDPLVVGDTTFLIKAIDNNGNYSLDATSVTVTIPVIPSPLVTGTSILNSALLNWTPPASTFRIDHYIIFRNGTPLTTTNGTFFAYQESISATNTYGVAAVDIKGNVGATQTVSITVTAPADFLLQAILSSTFAGTKTNAFLDTNRNVLEVCLNTTETYAHHFTANGWATPQDQITAGYPIYGEPAQISASYIEIFDFGSIFTNVAVGISWAFSLIAGTVSIATELEFSNDNITYTSPVAGPTAFASSVRYVKATINFTGGVTDVLEFFNFQCAMSVHQETDSGNVTAVSTDSGGTVVTLNKAFKSINSITVTIKQTATRWAIYDYTFNTVNPTTFKILVFDNAGVRQTETASWIVKGIL